MTQLHGTKTNGIEIRRNDDGSVDEVLMYVDGRCVVHVEQMYDECFWMALYGSKHTAHVNFWSKNRRSHVEAKVEAWRNELANN